MNRDLVKIAVQRMDSDDPTSDCVLVLFYAQPDGAGSTDVLMPIDSLDDVWRAAHDHGIACDAVEFRDSCRGTSTSATPEARELFRGAGRGLGGC